MYKPQAADRIQPCRLVLVGFKNQEAPPYSSGIRVFRPYAYVQQRQFIMNKIWNIYDGRVLVRQTPWSIRIGVPAVLLTLFCTGTCVTYFYIHPDTTVTESIYMTVITIATLGSRDAGRGGEWWTIITILGGLTLITILGAQITAFIVENRMLGIIGRQKVKKKIEALEGHVAVCGFGRTGQQVAMQLRDSGKTILVVENDPQRVSVALSCDFLVIQGDAQEEEIIAQMRLPLASTLVTCLANDAANLFLTLSARQENHELFIIARVMQESSMSKLRRAGANRVICPQLVGSNRIVDLVLRPEMVDFLEMTHSGVDLEMDRYEITPQSPLADKTLAEIALPHHVGAQVVAVRHKNGHINYHPTHDLKLIVGDVIILVGKEGINRAMEQFKM